MFRYNQIWFSYDICVMFSCTQIWFNTNVILQPDLIVTESNGNIVLLCLKSCITNIYWHCWRNIGCKPVMVYQGIWFKSTVIYWNNVCLAASVHNLFGETQSSESIVSKLFYAAFIFLEILLECLSTIRCCWWSWCCINIVFMILWW